MNRRVDNRSHASSKIRFHIREVFRATFVSIRLRSSFKFNFEEQVIDKDEVSKCSSAERRSQSTSEERWFEFLASAQSLSSRWVFFVVFFWFFSSFLRLDFWCFMLFANIIDIFSLICLQIRIWRNSFRQFWLKSCRKRRRSSEKENRVTSRRLRRKSRRWVFFESIMLSSV